MKRTKLVGLLLIAGSTLGTTGCGGLGATLGIPGASLGLTLGAPGPQTAAAGAQAAALGGPVGAQFTQAPLAPQAGMPANQAAMLQMQQQQMMQMLQQRALQQPGLMTAPARTASSENGRTQDDRGDAQDARIAYEEVAARDDAMERSSPTVARSRVASSSAPWTGPGYNPQSISRGIIDGPSIPGKPAAPTPTLEYLAPNLAWNRDSLTYVDTRTGRTLTQPDAEMLAQAPPDIDAK